jgi:hypothetical protein
MPPENTSMAKKVKVVRDDVYEQMGGAYQCVLAHILDTALRENGIKPKSRRQKIVELFVFTLGDFHDSGWMRPVEWDNEDYPMPANWDGRLYPILCFSERFLNVDTSIDDLKVLYAPSAGFAYHEGAHGSVWAYFDGDPEVEVELGEVGDEGDES